MARGHGIGESWRILFSEELTPWGAALYQGYQTGHTVWRLEI